jgi:hypothetical protein
MSDSRAMTLTAADRIEIHEVLARYAWSLDTGDEDGFISCFTPDAELAWEAFQEPGTWRGHEALRRFIAWFRAQPQSAGRQHHVSNIIVEPVPQGARARSYVLVALAVGDGPHRLHVMGYYEDELVRDGGTWRLSRRVIRDWRGAVLSNFPIQPEAPRPRPPVLDGLWATRFAGPE